MMSIRVGDPRRVASLALALLLGGALLVPLIGRGGAAAGDQAPDAESRAKLAFPIMDPARGRRLFVNKGCVLCHSVNGVGGRAAPVLDPSETELVDPFGLMARMWRGAAQMLALQSMELGYLIALDGDELADIVAFLASPRAQADFSLDEIPETMQDWLLDEPLAPFGDEQMLDGAEDGSSEF